MDKPEHNALQQDVERMTRHDLKNPLGLMLGYAGLFGEDPDLTGQQRESARYIESAAMQMLRMTNNSLGTGIGTYSAKLLTEVQNGRIRFETDDERGTRVWFSLPGAAASG